MDKVIFIGDLHLDSRTPESRIDDYGQTVLNKLLSLLDLAIANSVKTIICTGDMFEKYYEPVSYLVKVVDVFLKFKTNGIKFYSLIGNHDLPYNNMEFFKTTPLALLYKADLVLPFGLIEFEDFDIYGINFTQKDILSDIVSAASKKPKRKSIAVMHYAFNNTVPNESINIGDLKLFTMVVSGHDHMPYPLERIGGITILRPGSFTRQTKDDYNLKRKITAYMYVSGENSIYELILPGVEPADKVFSDTVFADKSFNLFSNKLNSLFDTKTEDYALYNIFTIIDNLPPTITQKSKDAVTKFLNSKGLKREENETSRKKTEKVEKEFSSWFT